MRSKLLITLTTAALAIGFNISAQAEDDNVIVAGAELYTLTNLHPDPVNMRLYTTNYLLDGSIPRCTKVLINKLSSKKMLFTPEGGTQYEYLHHKKSTPEGFSANLEKYFGTQCDPDDAIELSETDQQGIKEGRVLLGMTKQGVILAIGYPPEHVTPNTDLDQWRFWKNRFATRLVYFKDGKVTEIQG